MGNLGRVVVPAWGGSGTHPDTLEVGSFVIVVGSLDPLPP
jgi:hypothetical protein